MKGIYSGKQMGILVEHEGHIYPNAGRYAHNSRQSLPLLSLSSFRTLRLRHRRSMILVLNVSE